MPMRILTVRLPEWMWEALYKISQEEMSSMSSIIRRAIKEYLEKEGLKTE